MQAKFTKRILFNFINSRAPTPIQLINSRSLLQNLLCNLRPDRGLHDSADKCELWSKVNLDRLDIRPEQNDI